MRMHELRIFTQIFFIHKSYGLLSARPVCMLSGLYIYILCFLFFIYIYFLTADI